MSIKDMGVSFIAKQVLKPLVGRYAEIIDVSIDSKEKKIALQLLPKGESRSVSLKIENYEIVESEGKSKVVIREVSASREWITNLAQDYLVGKEMDIPDIARFALK